ncbi:MAG: cache domain-containing protein [Syntrophobacteraceae bacterium]
MPKFRGKDSEFIFAGTYVWIHDMSGTMRVHPIKYKMEGQKLIDLKDSNGKLFFTAMNEVAKTKGSGWVDYMWPKPGEKTPSLKVSYVKVVKVDGEDLVLGCGVYDMPPEEIQKLVK